MADGLVRGWTKHLTSRVPSPHRTDPLDRGLIGEWRFDPATGLVLRDHSGYGRHGTLSGPIWVTTEYGPALRSTSDAHRVLLGGTFPSGFSLTNFTLEAFFKAQSGAMVDDYELIGWLYNADPSIGLLLYDDVGYVGEFGIWINTTASGNVRKYSGQDLRDDMWHHGIGAYDSLANKTRFYVDGIMVNDTNDADEGPFSNFEVVNNPQIANTYLATEGFYGDIALIRFYNRALSDAEARARYQIVKKRAQPMTHVWMIPWAKAPTPAGILRERGTLRGVLRGAYRGV